MADDRPTRRVPVDVLRRLIEELLEAAGSDETSAKTAADAYVEADLRGHSIQGLDHLYSTVERLRSGRINPRPEPRIVRDGDAFALVDGDAALGQVAAKFAMDVACTKCAATGVAAVGFVNADDIFMLGYYAERLAQRGLVSLVCSNTYPPRVHPSGGLDSVLGTNPLAIGVPSGGPYPLVLDMATSTSAIGHVRLASYTDAPIPAGIAIDASGQPTTDARSALAGALTPAAGHKGFGLGLCVALLSGPLIGGAIGEALHEVFREPETASGARGHLLMTLDPAAFGDPETFRRAVHRYLEEIKASRREPGVDEILIPGERGLRQREESLVVGAVILETVWKNTAKLATELGVRMPS
jgi:LDH2 family malate/lactate/ureidoglycolate dehydrogenase